MISSRPTSTRQPPEKVEQEKVKNDGGPPAPPKKKAGQSPTTRILKSIFRPILKGLYYLLRGMRSHKLITLIMIVLILGSATTVNFFKTGNWPFGIGYDQYNFQINGGDGGGVKISNWLHALREGDVPTLQLLDSFMSQQPDTQGLVNQFSKQHFSWQAINRLSISEESDTTIDSFWEVDLSNVGPGGPVVGYLVIHFVTVAAQQGDVIVAVDVLPFRAAQA
ncbi:MAG TPA: hypothetical protein VFQ36_17380 [Ktedonobacteraceae bacterium]|nr:hypothetical protein [Ktedonobacteraceae bacterium]